MNTRRLDTRIIALLDGEALPAERDALAQLMQNDPECAAAHAEWHALTQEWRAALNFPERPYSFAVLKARLREVSALEEVRLFLPRVRLDSPLPRMVLAMLFLAALGVSWVAGWMARSQGVDVAERLRDRRDRVDEVIAMTADPGADWPVGRA